MKRWLGLIGMMAVATSCAKGADTGRDVRDERPPACKHGERTYQPGEAFSIDCNECVCGIDGSATCTEQYCGDARAQVPVAPDDDRVPLLTPVPAKPAPGTLRMRLPIQQPWTDTGLDVEVGQRVCIEVTGSVTFGDPAPQNRTDPDGTDSPVGTCHHTVTSSAVRAHAVVANIAASKTLDGNGFFVGSHFVGAIPPGQTTRTAGRLWLGFNDAGVNCDRRGINRWAFAGDNRGSFEVTITLDCETSDD